MQVLNMSGMYLSEGALQQLHLGMVSFWRELRVLDLTACNASRMACDYLAVGLPHCTKLEALHLGHNPIGRGMVTLAPALGSCPALRLLYLGDVALDDLGLQALARVLPNIPRLSTLDLSHVSAEVGSLTCLHAALSSCAVRRRKERRCRT